MKTGIYMIRNKVNDKKYIGQAVDIDRRWRDHKSELNGNKHGNQYLQNSWNKYGEDNFEFTIICLCEEEELNEFEIDMIAHYHTFYEDGGYNLTLGGEGARGYKHTDEQLAHRQSDEYRRIHSEAMNRPEIRAKISEAKKEYYKDPEVKKKHREALNRPEVKKKHSESLKEYFKDPENRKKRSEALNRPEIKKKHREVMKEYYKDPENRKKHSEAMKKAVYCVTNNIIYASTVEAGEKLNIPGGHGTVSWACKGKYTSEYAKKYINMNGHIYKSKDGKLYEFWFLDEYEEKFGKVAI